MTGYITTSEFFSSNFLCAFSQCCSISGEALSGCVSSLIDIATSMVDNYLGRSLWVNNYIDIINGNDAKTYHSRYTPIQAINKITYEGKLNACSNYQYNNNYNINLSQTSGIVSLVNLLDDRTGWVEIIGSFQRSKRYKMFYTAGYQEIPEDIKTAVKMLVAQLSVQIDTGNLSNADVSHDTVKLDTVSFKYGSSNINKQITTSNMNDLNWLPMPVERILKKYKYSSSMSV